MPHPQTPADSRDDRAAERDDVADHRDATARDRDAAAARRDAEAAERDDEARRHSSDTTDRFRRVSRQILDCFARIENATVNPGDWPDLTPAALAHLQEHTAEQRRLVRLDRAAVAVLLDELGGELAHLRHDRHDAARDRRSSSSDREHSAGDRGDAGGDRDLSARDRNQGVVEREQVDARDLPRTAGSTHPTHDRDSARPPIS